MKFKLIPIFVGELGLMTCLAGAVSKAAAQPIAIGTTPHSILAEDSTSSPEPVTRPESAPIPPPPLLGLDGINLTTQQQEQIKQLLADLQPQFKAVAPTPPQLTAEEQAKIQQIVQPFRARIEAVLTPEQLQQLRQNQDNSSKKPPELLAQLNLTPQQQEQIKQINQEMWPQLRAALPTPPQLTVEQKEKMQQLMQSFRERLEAILTPEQQQQLGQNLEQFRQDRTGGSPQGL